MEIKIGCDPEVFVRNPNSKQFQCAYNMVPGTKQNPYKVPHGAVQVDGMALEFNIDPATTADEFLANVQNVYHELQRMVPGYELVAQPTANFTRKTMADAPAESLELGCDPDFNAWHEGRPNPRPDPGKRLFRTGAGHVHIGWTEGADIKDPVHIADCIHLVKCLDMTLGAPAQLYDKDDKRRLLYGSAGAFRPKPYGVEYRVLSNAWLTDPALIKWVFNQTKRTVELAAEDKIDTKGPLFVYASKLAVTNERCFDRYTRPKMRNGLTLPPVDKIQKAA